MPQLILTSITGLSKRVRFPHCKITHHLSLLSNIFKHKRFKCLTSGYLHHHQMWPHLQACVTSPLQKITLILYRHRQAWCSEGRGDTERTQCSKEKGLSRDPENTSLWGWTSILHWTWKCEPEWTDRTIFGKHYYLGSKFSYHHTNTRKDILIRLDVGVPLLEHPRDTAGWLRAGRLP